MLAVNVKVIGHILRFCRIIQYKCPCLVIGWEFCCVTIWHDWEMSRAATLGVFAQCLDYYSVCRDAGQTILNVFPLPAHCCRSTT